MKKLLLILFLLFPVISFAATDRVQVQVCFRKALWTCPVCGIEEIEDRNMSGGDSYEHTCKNGHKFNQSGSNMKEYNGCLLYPKGQYETMKQKDIDAEKTKRMDDWIYEIKHPPVYVEPSVEDLEKEQVGLMEQVNLLQERINAKTAIPISD